MVRYFPECQIDLITKYIKYPVSNLRQKTLASNHYCKLTSEAGLGLIWGGYVNHMSKFKTLDNFYQYDEENRTEVCTVFENVKGI